MREFVAFQREFDLLFATTDLDAIPMEPNMCCVGATLTAGLAVVALAGVM